MSKNWYRAIIILLVLINIILANLYSKENKEEPSSIITGTVENIVENGVGDNRWMAIKTSSGLVATVYERGTNFLRGMKVGDQVSIEIVEISSGYKVIGVIYE